MERAIKKIKREGKKGKQEKKLSSKAREQKKKAKPELGFVDLAEQTMECSTTGSIVLVNTIPQGTTQSQRVGKQVQLKYLILRGFFQQNSSGVINNCVLLVVYDRMSNGAAIPAITDILNTANANSMNNANNERRFKVLRRISLVLTGEPTTGSNGSEMPYSNVEEFISLKGLDMEWNNSATTGVQSTIQRGAIYLVTVGSAATGLTASSLFIQARTRYAED